MIFIKILISIIPIFLIFLFGLITNNNKKDITTLSILGFVAILGVMIFNQVIGGFYGCIYLIFNIFIPNLHDNLLLQEILLIFLHASAEELIKRLVIDASKPRSPYAILYNCMYIASIFISLENISYMSNQPFANYIGLYRSFLPVHLCCQLIMAFLIIRKYEKQDNSKYKMNCSILSIILPITIHTLYNCLITYDNLYINCYDLKIHPIAIFLGILIYGITFIYMLKTSNKYPIYKTDVKRSSKLKIVIKNITLFILIFLWIIIFL